MSVTDFIGKIKDVFGDKVNYKPYDLRDTVIMYGVPPVPIKGLEYVYAQHMQPRTKLVMSLTGDGVFVGNQNQAGIIEIDIMTGSVSCAGIEVMELTGIPFPMAITDKSTAGTSTVLASACRRVGTPEWRREAFPGISVFTFATPRLLISDGLRMLESA